MTWDIAPDNSRITRDKTALLWFIFFLFLLRTYPADAVTKTANITVNATLLPTCIAGTTVGGTTSFGTLNFGSATVLNTPIAVTGQANSGAISVQCSKSTSFSVLLSPGQSGSVNNRYLAGGPTSQHVNYNLYTDLAHSQIWDNTVGVSQVATGQPVTLPVYGLIPIQSTPAAGIYTDTIQVTVNW
ncbi:MULTISPECIES: spore coat U domain-containing protein [Yersinia]|uniref:Spore Coat Protein U domain protein n=1 Tax=Yersinia rochesterensis TaxID=1604335 RepID=A0ABM5SKN2_9GAMM|nr:MULTISPECIES: spore coat U domain-containing protein [Yersinia]AJI88273.1 spore Coat Protein U domain protein [Yersinia frederiksenii Y225]CNG72666.1 sigma-fimbriae subunit [Yersinia kristensenii]AIN17213.1 spore Coat Protein U domain protein [Yersinia rochesterensis]AJJ35045.1 spore Coat Protein U domain protein [Yersinia rochesterensis]MDA5543302.1 spore coat U domain-containing protein [Yersinia rochesterensis]